MKSDAPIMIVDDEPSIRHMMRTTFETDDYSVVEAEEGQDAVELLGRIPVSLVVLDLHMPLMDGLAVLRHMRQTGNITPVVMMAAESDVPDVVTAMKLGAVDFIRKPMYPNALRETVARALRDRRQPIPRVLQMPDRGVVRKARLAEKIERAQSAIMCGEFDRAEFFLDQALQIDPDATEATQLLQSVRQRPHEDEFVFRGLRSLFPCGRPQRVRR